ncbi:MAG TPA: tRNA (adenosine(37)-N6)-threonylcarbamoyltransferase complex transferase subunit TsaD, partial [Burkholderiaceae bacterium]|nr:tRNA (adenosine(37)-N6)-threonylcarbamoyltransferase complex transferase subunit TsaD [Burkholderiaceae bacterium]
TGALHLPRPMIDSGTLDVSFSGLKTAVANAVRRAGNLCEQVRADIAREFVDAVIDVLTAKSLLALERTGLSQLVVAGGVGANVQLRASLDAALASRGGCVFYPPAELCTDNGAMIAYAGYVRLTQMPERTRAASALPLKVRPRWNLCDLQET